jgi:hypothetical protein
MTTPKLEAAQQRLERMLEQKKALEAKISREQGRLREQEHKARTRRLIEYGGLVAIAGLDTADKGTVLGLLLEGARRLAVDPQAAQRWQAVGDQELAQRAAQATVPTIREELQRLKLSTADEPTETEGDQTTEKREGLSTE